MHGHGEALFRAVRNLVENALRHTPPGGGVEVDVAADGSVRVLDEGPGVPEAERETIFRRFWRRDRSRSDSRGLGLAIVVRIAEAHGGRITVANRPQGGAQFTLQLRPAPPPSATPGEPAPAVDSGTALRWDPRTRRLDGPRRLDFATPLAAGK